MRVVGLTGGIASGKTTVSDAFAALGIPIIDTDRIARELTEPDQPAFHDIVRYFRADSLNPDGTLDRAWLRRHIFSDDTARHLLEVILHPPIYAAVDQRLQALRLQAQAPYVVVVIPLLAEHPEYLELLDRVLVVDVPEAVQRERLMARDGSDAQQIEQILAAQASRTQRLSLADDVIDNQTDPAAITRRVAELDQQYRQPG